MGGKIEIYMDIASYFSYMAFSNIQQNRELFGQNGVVIDFHPVIIGAITTAVGNKPPWSVKVKGAYLDKYDSKRSAKALGMKDLSAPDDLMIAGRTIAPMRALTYIKTAFSPEVLTTTFAYFFHAFWTLHKVPNDPAMLKEVLSEIPADFKLHVPSSSSSKRLFTAEQVAQILAATTTLQIKDAMKDRVAEATSRGAFGAPWIWMTNARGVSEPVFGSDRWEVVYEFLGLPHQKLRLLAPSKARL
ncbi:thioredoxin-like protein [Xylaria nigripes]|nr:thioredoxin-like protein [Xylaria nigripes]